jgi:hypothetical protein
MNTKITRPPRVSTNGARPQAGKAAAPPVTGALRASWLLSAAIAALMAVASAAGLWIGGLYPDPAWVGASLRGGDLATLVVAAPLLAVTLLPAVRGSQWAELMRAGLLAYSLYNYAFYVFGAAFNDIFLLHVALFSASIFALALTLATIDLAGLGRRIRWPGLTRWVSGYLLLVATVLGGMWTFFSLRFATTGTLPETAFPPAGLHLIYTLDLSLLVPSFALAAVLLWRRSPFGYALATAASVYGAVYQLNYMAATLFQANAKVPGVAAFDPLTVVLTIGFVLALGFMLRGLGSESRSRLRP